MRAKEGVQTKTAATETPTICRVQWTQPLRRKREKRQEQRKKQRRRLEERRTFRINSNSDPRRGCLANAVTADTLPEDGLYIGRSTSVPGGQQGWGNPWKVNDDTVHSHQKVVEYCGKMMSSPSGRWLRRRLHEVRSKDLFVITMKVSRVMVM